ncbi:MAG: DUF11 domain-containing protein, partial [Lentisphaeria bacterium]|nr:DUF11 domain-containing protein [Lentisphaeria bacterium]
ACAVHAAAPIVDITKGCPEMRYLGRSATFEITVTNRGDGSALNVVVRDVITGGVGFVSADNGGVREGDAIVWRLGNLGAGQAKVLKATLNCDQIGRVSNTATVSYCAEAAASCAFEVKGIPAILLECVDDPDPIEVGGQLTYSITVLNQGSAMGTNIAVTCTLPPEEEYVSSDGPTEAKVSGKAVTFAPLPSLAPQAKAVYHLQVKGVAPGDVRFRVDMKSDQIERPVMETESTNIY